MTQELMGIRILLAVTADRLKAQLYHMFNRAPALLVPRAQTQVDQARGRGHPRFGRPQIETPRKGQSGTRCLCCQTAESPEYMLKTIHRFGLLHAFIYWLSVRAQISPHKRFGK